MSQAKLVMAQPQLSRRRVLRLVAAAAGLPLAALGVRALSPHMQEYNWKGEALGALADMSIWHHDRHKAQRMIAQIETEITRYEQLFSLFRPDSAISLLNQQGSLQKADPDFIELINESLKLGNLSQDAFDISVQPLWKLYEKQFWISPGSVADLDHSALQMAKALVDYRQIAIEGRNVSFKRPGMAITLNGIAQGFLTDRVSDLLRWEGFETALVDLGEMRALGQHPEGRPWRLGVKDPAHPGAVSATLELTDMALAVSGGYGTLFEPSGRHHHIFDPNNGQSAMRLRDAAVIATRATHADGLATALCVTGVEGAALLLAAYPEAQAYVTLANGARQHITNREVITITT
jgi:thiamine biosynthesis lipoprotein